MTRTHKTYTTLRRSLLLTLLGAWALSATGCIINNDQTINGDIVADLEVVWSVNGSQAARLCDDLGISRWIVDVVGPDSRQVLVDCRKDYWSSENDLLLMTEGTYSIGVSALDSRDVELATLQTRHRLYDTGDITVLELAFDYSDFE